MAENIDHQLAENFFQAIDTIATNRVNSVKFDKTLTCQIVDTTNSAKGEYVVSDGMTQFLAYSENPSYEEGLWVYVTVPNSDFDQQKLIVGKYVSDNTEYSTYVNPLSTYLDITGNLISIDNENPFGLIANNTNKSEIIIWSIGDINLAPYDSSQPSPQEFIDENRLAIDQLQQTYQNAKSLLISTYGEDTPEYLAALTELDATYQEDYEALAHVEQNIINSLNNSVSLTTKTLSRFDRLGIQASFLSYLKNYNIISGNYGLRLDIRTTDPGSTSTVRTYQSVSLKLDNTNMFGNPYNFSMWSQQQLVFDISEFTDIVGMQLIFYQDNNFINENNKLIPEYSDTLTDAEKQMQENAYLAMNNIFVKDIYVSLGYDLNEFSTDTVLLYSFDPLTYSTYLQDTNKEILAEQYPELNLNTEEGVRQGLDIVNKKTIELRWVHVDSENDTIKAINDESDFETWQWYHDDGFTEEYISKIHWYRWKMEDDVKDELAGAFWQRQDGTNGTPDLEDSFIWEDFQPNINASEDRVKVLIEYPSKNYMDNQSDDSVDDYLESHTAEWEQEVINELYPNNTYNNKNLFHITAVKTALKIRLAKEREAYYATSLGDCSLYSSPILTFTSEQEVPNTATIDLIEALELVCDSSDEGGYDGVYSIYNTDGQIINNNEASKRRIIKATFDTLITGDATLDSAETIRWYFPVNSTMIEAPVAGCEYTARDWGTIDWTALGLTTDDEKEEFKHNYPFFNLSDNEINQLRQSSIFAEFAGLTKDRQWFCIERQGVQQYTDRAKGAIVPTELEQIFRIKPYYSQSAVNNTIRCEVYKNNKIYSAEYTLYFGTFGANGTDYTLLVNYEEQKEDGSWVPITISAFDCQGGKIRIIPHILDYEHHDLTEQYQGQFSYDFYAQPPDRNHQGLSINGNIITRNTILDENNKLLYEAYYHYILKVSVHLDVTLNATNNNEDATQIDQTNGEPITMPLSLTGYYPLAIRFDSQYTNMDGDGRITYDTTGVNPVYYKNNFTIYSLMNSIPTKVNDIVWSIEIGEKNEDNSLSITQYYPQIDAITGMLIVPAMYISDNDPCVSVVASIEGNPIWCQPLYISQQVYASAFLNSWDGSLSIDEEKGTIMSAMMGAGYKDDENRFNGVLMGNVSKGIDAGENSDTGLFGYHQGQQSFGFNIDGTAFLGKQGRGRIEFSGNAGTIESASWRWGDQQASGMSIDLDDAFIDFRGPTRNWPIGENNTNISGQVTMHLGVHSNNSNDQYSYFNIGTPQNDLIDINPEQGHMFLQSWNFNDYDQGVRFDLANGELIGYDFSLLAYGIVTNEDIANGITNKFIKISSSDPNYPLEIGDNFKVDWAGTVSFNDAILNNADVSGEISATKFYAYDTDHSIARVVVDNNGLSVYDGFGLDGSNLQARFGSDIYVGDADSRLYISNYSIQLFNAYGKLTIDSSGVNVQKVGSALGSFTFGSEGYALLSTTYITLNIGTINAKKTKTITKQFSSSTHRAIGVLGYNIDKGTNGESGISLLNVYACYINSSQVVTVQLRNLSTSSARKGNQIKVYLLLTPISTTWSANDDGTGTIEGSEADDSD